VPADPLTLTVSQIASRAEQLAKQWLKDPKCQSIFDLSGNGFNPLVVLQSLISTGSYSSGLHTITLQFTNVTGPYSGADGLTTPNLNPVAALLPFPVGEYVGLGASVVINTGQFGGYDPSSVVQEIAATILHELGHAYNFTPGSGGSSMSYDGALAPGGSQAASNANSSIVNQDCWK
jgi:hypothetical protein